MAVIHMTEAEAARDFAGVMAKARAGEEVRIGADGKEVSIMTVPREVPRPRLLSEVIAALKLRGSEATLDDQFGRDMEAVIAQHAGERLIDPWESF